MLDPFLVQYPGFVACGVSARTNNANEIDVQTALIRRLWQQFYRDGVAIDLKANAENGRIVAVYTHYDNGSRGDYTMLAGAQLRRSSAPVPGYDTLTVSAGEYIVFKAPGFGGELVAALWIRIMNFFSRAEHELAGRYERAYTADFEVYGDPSHVAIYVAVKRRLGVSSQVGKSAAVNQNQTRSGPVIV